MCRNYSYIPELFVVQMKNQRIAYVIMTTQRQQSDQDAIKWLPKDALAEHYFYINVDFLKDASLAFDAYSFAFGAADSSTYEFESKAGHSYTFVCHPNKDTDLYNFEKRPCNENLVEKMIDYVSYICFYHAKIKS